MPTLNSPTRSVSRSEVVEGILDLAATCRLPIGAKTSELEIAKLLGFESRTPIVREALALLIREGIVEQRPQVGHTISRVSPAEAREVLQLLAGIEAIVVKELASQERSVQLEELECILVELESIATAADEPKRAVDRLANLFADNAIEQLHSFCEKLVARDPAESAAFMKTDAQFRCELARVGGYFAAVQTIWGWMSRLRVFRIAVPLSVEEMKTVVYGHRRLLELIRQRDSVGAQVAVEQQLEVALQQLADMEQAGDDAKERRAVIEEPVLAGDIEVEARREQLRTLPQTLERAVQQATRSGKFIETIPLSIPRTAANPAHNPPFQMSLPDRAKKYMIVVREIESGDLVVNVRTSRSRKRSGGSRLSRSRNVTSTGARASKP